MASDAIERARPEPAAGPELRTWYAALLGGLVPILLLGFVASALADRLAFAGWALALAAAYTVLLREGLAAPWPRPYLSGVLALLLAAGLAAFGWLEAAHFESLDLGFRAALPGLHHPVLTRPATALVLAAALALAGVASLVRGRAR